MSFTERYVHALWCDDIRHELGNKPSFMGVYTGGLVVSKLPIVLPRLCVFAWVVAPLDHPIKHLAAKLVRDSGEVLASVDQLPGPKTPAEVLEGSTRLSALVAIVLTNVQVPEGTNYFCLQVETESEILDGPKLFVTVNPARILQTMPIPGAPEDVGNS